MLTIGVIGAGTMGSGIAEVAAAVGQVILLDVDAERAKAGLAGIEKRLNRQVERGYLEAEQRDERLSRITVSADLQTLKDADIVVEAVSENLELKQDLFRSLAEICSSQCILGTNTSALSVTAIAAVTGEPQRVLGIHFLTL